LLVIDAHFSSFIVEEAWQTLYLLLTTFQTLSYMKIQTFNVGMLSTNCYVVNCPKTQEAIIIDPGFDAPQEAEQICRYVDKNTLKVKFIVNTHGHSDHIRGDSTLKKKYSVPICIHAYDAHRLTGLGENTQPANILLEDEALLKFGKVTLKIMHTPGHTPGSISLVGEKLVFTGDTLFAGGIGRTDLPGGSDRDMRLSLEKLLRLPEHYVVYPGHGATSIIGEEKRVNPFLQWL
jgi:glyoxylase-like metal-dependent hydrolase (beta-lactamase superfamily II)